NIILNDPPTIVAMVCWSGTVEEGARVLRELRAFGPPEKDLVNTVGPLHLMDRLPQLGYLLGPPPPRGRQGPPSIYLAGRFPSRLEPCGRRSVCSHCASSSAGEFDRRGALHAWAGLSCRPGCDSASPDCRTVHVFHQYKLVCRGFHGVGGSILDRYE